MAKQVNEENYEKGLIYPPFSIIRKISADIAANVASKAYELGKSPLCSKHYARPKRGKKKKERKKIQYIPVYHFPKMYPAVQSQSADDEKIQSELLKIFSASSQ